ncbi:MAG TPA: hypothetical protein VN372_05490 [Methanospirillum sp.]|nr:hypothetical protein [Methanospirillum sp.]
MKITLFAEFGPGELCPRFCLAILFGACPMGSHRYGSDIDIAIEWGELTLEDLRGPHTLIDDVNLKECSA